MDPGVLYTRPERRWTAEEGRHAILLRDYLTVTRGLDPERLEQARTDMVLRGWYPRFAEEGPLDGVVFATIAYATHRWLFRFVDVPRIASLPERTPRGRDEKEDIMITPASLGDWVMFGGLVGSLGAAAALGYRFILAPEPEEPVAMTSPSRSLPNFAETPLHVGTADRGERVGAR